MSWLIYIIPTDNNEDVGEDDDGGKIDADDEKIPVLCFIIVF